jgi:hypothetical protein
MSAIVFFIALLMFVYAQAALVIGSTSASCSPVAGFAVQQRFDNEQVISIREVLTPQPLNRFQYVAYLRGCLLGLCVSLVVAGVAHTVDGVKIQ